jgi:hypothetical protein
MGTKSHKKYDFMYFLAIFYLLTIKRSFSNYAVLKFTHISTQKSTKIYA